MLRRFLNWLARPSGPRPAGRRRSRASGCLLWILILIGLLVILSLFFGSFQKGTRVTGMPFPLPLGASVHTGTYPAETQPSHGWPAHPRVAF